MPEYDLVPHRAPTLAGIQVGSPFTCACKSRCNLRDTVRQLNR